jgi:hypothetical protein
MATRSAPGGAASGTALNVLDRDALMRVSLKNVHRAAMFRLVPIESAFRERQSYPRQHQLEEIY